MADRPISNLPAATTVNEQDLLVLQQNRIAMSLSGRTLINFLAEKLDGHGGISSITGPVKSVLNDTYTIHYADQTTSTFTVANGKGITGITKTSSGLRDEYTISYNDGDSYPIQIDNGRSISSITGPIASGLDDTYTIHYNDNTTSVFVVTNGEKGDTGDTGPKGDKGDKGDSTTIASTSVEYGTSPNSTVMPQDWVSYVPTVDQGAYLWTRTMITYSDGTETTAYSTARNGMDGTGGTVRSVHGVLSDTNGNVDCISVQDTVLVIGVLQ